MLLGHWMPTIVVASGSGSVRRGLVGKEFVWLTESVTSVCTWSWTQEEGRVEARKWQKEVSRGNQIVAGAWIAMHASITALTQLSKTLSYQVLGCCMSTATLLLLLRGTRMKV
jgi:hypothetical protein